MIPPLGLECSRADGALEYGRLRARHRASVGADGALPLVAHDSMVRRDAGGGLAGDRTVIAPRRRGPQRASGPGSTADRARPGERTAAVAGAK